MASSKQLTCLTISIIQSNIHKAHKLLEDLKYEPRKRLMQNGYVMRVAEEANINDGMPCMRCEHYIKPYAECYVKYRHNNSVAVPTYYHNSCFEKLYQ